MAERTRSDKYAGAVAELRARLWAFLDHPDRPEGVDTFAWWDPLIKRTKASISAIETADNVASLIDAVATVVAEFRAEAYARGKKYFALSPLYPWGIICQVDALLERLRYRQVARAHEGDCNCALVIEHRFLEQVRTTDFVKIGSSNDSYDPFDDYRCPHCKRRWRREDCSTEQYTSFRWRALDEG